MPQLLAPNPRITTLVVARHDERVLLLLRRKPPNEGLWSPPGGKVEGGEEPLAGALREFREETGLEATRVSLAAIISELDNTRAEAWLMFVYRAFADGEPTGDPREGQPAWVAIADLPLLPKPPADAAMLEAALAPTGLVFIQVTMDDGQLAGVVVHPVPGIG